MAEVFSTKIHPNTKIPGGLLQKHILDKYGKPMLSGKDTDKKVFSIGKSKINTDATQFGVIHTQTYDGIKGIKHENGFVVVEMYADVPSGNHTVAEEHALSTQFYTWRDAVKKALSLNAMSSRMSGESRGNTLKIVRELEMAAREAKDYVACKFKNKKGALGPLQARKSWKKIKMEAEMDRAAWLNKVRPQMQDLSPEDAAIFAQHKLTL